MSKTTLNGRTIAASACFIANSMDIGRHIYNNVWVMRKW